MKSIEEMTIGELREHLEGGGEVTFAVDDAAGTTYAAHLTRHGSYLVEGWDKNDNVAQPSAVTSLGALLSLMDQYSDGDYSRWRVASEAPPG